MAGAWPSLQTWVSLNDGLVVSLGSVKLWLWVEVSCVPRTVALHLNPLWWWLWWLEAVVVLAKGMVALDDCVVVLLLFPQDLVLVVWVGGHPESNFHVVRRAPPANSSVQVAARWRWDEVVVLAWPELQTSRCRRKRPECDGEVHLLERPITDGDDFWVWLRYSACVKLFFRDAVDDVFFLCVLRCPRLVDRTHNVDLVIRVSTTFNVNEIVLAVIPEHWIGCVPVNVVDICWVDSGCHIKQCHDNYEQARWQFGTAP